MTTEHSLSRHVHSFFHDYLARQRDLSPNTVLSYRDTLKLFLQFAATQLGRPVVDLSLDVLDVDLVLLFLDYLEEQRNNSAATRNVRLAASAPGGSFFLGPRQRTPLSNRTTEPEAVSVA